MYFLHISCTVRHCLCVKGPVWLFPAARPLRPLLWSVFWRRPGAAPFRGPRFLRPLVRPRVSSGRGSRLRVWAERLCAVVSIRSPRPAPDPGWKCQVEAVWSRACLWPSAAPVLAGESCDICRVRDGIVAKLNGSVCRQEKAVRMN